ncbi:MAG TPA: glycoside hydrolase family 3 N-terminal domain-containing protein [Acidimicrobiales bacterium]|nr:glycoside hydrolase family 3 N-terminal domain-containing protein [Acidimicrobiales bacterium]
MHDPNRTRVLVVMVLVGVVLVAGVVWITTTPQSAGLRIAELDAAAGTGLTRDRSLNPITPGPTLAGSGTTVPAAAPRKAPSAGAGSGSGPVATSAGLSPVAGCTPAPLAQRAARTLIVGLPDITDPSDPLVEKVLEIGVGGIFLSPGNVESRPQLLRLIKGIRAQAGRPILVSIDEEPGRVSTLGDLIGTSRSARRMADEDKATDVRAYATTVATELSRLGIDVNLAPVADLTDGAWDEVIGDRSFSIDPAVASEYAMAYSQGMADGGVRPVAKHFPGQGRSADEVHYEAAEPVTVPLDTLRLTDVRPFRDLVRAGIPVVMMNHLRYTALDRGLPASLSPKAYSLLRDLGFEGVAITDSLGMGAVNLTWGFYDSAPMAIAAGADGLLATDGFFAEEMRDGLVDAIAAGRLSETRMNEAAARMVALAGGDPRVVSCLAVDLPRIEPAPLPVLATTIPRQGF